MSNLHRGQPTEPLVYSHICKTEITDVVFNYVLPLSVGGHFVFVLSVCSSQSLYTQSKQELHVVAMLANRLGRNE
jgi:hypothetical protein